MQYELDLALIDSGVQRCGQSAFSPGGREGREGRREKGRGDVVVGGFGVERRRKHSRVYSLTLGTQPPASCLVVSGRAGGRKDSWIVGRKEVTSVFAPCSPWYEERTYWLLTLLLVTSHVFDASTLAAVDGVDCSILAHIQVS